MTDPKPQQDLPKPPPPLPSTIRLVLALSALSSTQTPSPPSPYIKNYNKKWLLSICKLLEIDPAQLPPSISVENIRSTAEEARGEWSPDEITRMAGILVEGSLATETLTPQQKAQKQQQQKNGEGDQLRYTPLARSLSYRTLENLGLDAKNLVPQAEKNLSVMLFKALKAGEEKDQKVESMRAAASQGWGGALGRHLATGAGVIAGGVLLGVTGGLAAPAIAAVLAPLGIGGLIGGAAAPVVLGTLFGVGGGGLSGKRVRERWKGVEEFSFIEIGAGTKASVEEMEDLKAARERYKARERKKVADEKAAGEAGGGIKAVEGEKNDEAQVVDQEPSKGGSIAAQGQDTAENQVGGKETLSQTKEVTAEQKVEEDRLDLESQLLNLSIEAGTRTSISDDTSPRTSMDSPRTSLDQGREVKGVEDIKKAPSLTATIVIPGLLTVSKTEALTAWRSICSSNTSSTTIAPLAVPREKSSTEKTQPESAEATATALPGLKDGRDVYLLRFETTTMLKTGRDIDLWVEQKLKGKIKAEIIKRTVLSAYFAAVSLPLTVYSMASMGLDNTWMQAQDRASKAGKLLGEVLEKRVQGERPVVLIGSSLGALTILKALLYLASLPPPAGSGLSPTSLIPNYVESAFLISLPSAPTPEEWSKCRGVVARRLVNAWSEADFVLAGVVRLHEVVSRAATLSSGIRVAGLGPVNQPGIQDVDVSSVLRGHMELQAKMPDVLRIIDIDA